MLWVPRGFRIPKPDQSGLWPHGLTQVKRAYSPVGYVIKYSSKGGLEEHDIPKGARLFGVGGGGDAERLATHRAGLPMWLFARLEPGARARRVARLGWVCSITGEIFSSPFSVTWGRDEWGIPWVIITGRVQSAIENQECRGRDAQGEGGHGTDQGQGIYVSGASGRRCVGEEVRLIALMLDDDQAAYPVGEYEVLLDGSVEVDRNNQLALKRRLALKPVSAATPASRVA